MTTNYQDFDMLTFINNQFRKIDNSYQTFTSCDVVLGLNKANPSKIKLLKNRYGRRNIEFDSFKDVEMYITAMQKPSLRKKDILESKERNLNQN